MAKGKKTYKYQIISEQLQPYGHMLYLIRYTSKNGAKSEQWFGQSKLKRFYEQDRLDGDLSSHVMSVVKAELKKSQGRTRGKVKLTPRDENYKYTDKPTDNWQVQDESIASPIKPNLYKGMFDDIPADENDY